MDITIADIKEANIDVMKLCPGWEELTDEQKAFLIDFANKTSKKIYEKNERVLNGIEGE